MREYTIYDLLEHNRLETVGELLALREASMHPIDVEDPYVNELPTLYVVKETSFATGYR